MSDQELTVTQRDRDAAAALVRVRQERAARFAEDETVADMHPEFIQDGSSDFEDVVQAFARHRLQAEAEGRAELLAKALEWYAEQAEGCRKLGHIGDPARQALDADGGKRAREALSLCDGEPG